MEDAQMAAPVAAPAAETRLKQNGFVRPAAGSRTGLVWDWADYLYNLAKTNGEEHPVPTIGQVKEKYMEAIEDAQIATCQTQYGRWVKYHGLGDELAAKREATKGEMTEAQKAKAEERERKKAEREAAKAAKAEERELKKKEREEAKAAKEAEKAERKAAREAEKQAKAAEKAAKAAEKKAQAEAAAAAAAEQAAQAAQAAAEQAAEAPVEQAEEAPTEESAEEGWQ